MSVETSQEFRQIHQDLMNESHALARKAFTQIRQSRNAILRSRELIARSGASRLRETNKPLSERTTIPGDFFTPAPEVVLERVSGKRFAGVSLSLDGKHFVDCAIENCVLDYGGEQVVLERTHFSGCSFRWRGAAAKTLSLMECFNILGTGAPASEPSETGPARKSRIN